ncbi:uncharacterized protein LOC135097283 [Scylla paramamosain]|uniref:uncharacterized protein LOC135097283 n=1 Tax=Scylla paramamosain TaxID=85552 RepID=UPI003082703F
MHVRHTPYMGEYGPCTELASSKATETRSACVVTTASIKATDRPVRVLPRQEGSVASPGTSRLTPCFLPSPRVYTPALLRRVFPFRVASALASFVRHLPPHSLLPPVSQSLHTCTLEACTTPAREGCPKAASQCHTFSRPAPHLRGKDVPRLPPNVTFSCLHRSILAYLTCSSSCCLQGGECLHLETLQ